MVGPKCVRLAMTLVLIGGFVGCAKSDSAQEKRLLGSWEERVVTPDGLIIEGKTTYMVEGKMSFSGVLKKDGEEVLIVGSGTWKLKDGFLHSTVTTSNLPQVLPNGYATVDKVISVNDRELITQDADGKTSVATRSK